MKEVGKSVSQREGKKGGQWARQKKVVGEIEVYTYEVVGECEKQLL